MKVISMRELTQNQSKYFDLADEQRVIIKCKNRFFQIVDLGDGIPELDDSLISKEEFFTKIDRSIEDYKQGKGSVISTKEELNNYLNEL